MTQLPALSTGGGDVEGVASRHTVGALNDAPKLLLVGVEGHSSWLRFILHDLEQVLDTVASLRFPGVGGDNGGWGGGLRLQLSVCEGIEEGKKERERGEEEGKNESKSRQIERITTAE